MFMSMVGSSLYHVIIMEHMPVKKGTIVTGF